jgi:hypothetical protein
VLVSAPAVEPSSVSFKGCEKTAILLLGIQFSVVAQAAELVIGVELTRPEVAFRHAGRAELVSPCTGLKHIPTVFAGT